MRSAVRQRRPAPGAAEPAPDSITICRRRSASVRPRRRRLRPARLPPVGNRGKWSKPKTSRRTLSGVRLAPVELFSEFSTRVSGIRHLAAEIPPPLRRMQGGFACDSLWPERQRHNLLSVNAISIDLLQPDGAIDSRKPGKRGEVLRSATVWHVARGFRAGSAFVLALGAAALALAPSRAMADPPAAAAVTTCVSRSR